MVYGKKWGLREALKKSEILKMEGTVPDLWVYKGLVVIGRRGCALIRDTKLIICGRES